jgi:hypothetical protein
MKRNYGKEEKGEEGIRENGNKQRIPLLFT